MEQPAPGLKPRFFQLPIQFFLPRPKKDPKQFSGFRVCAREGASALHTFFHLITLQMEVVSSFYKMRKQWLGEVKSSVELVRERTGILFSLGGGCSSAGHVGSQFPDQELNLCPLQQKLGVLTTGPSGKAQNPCQEPQRCAVPSHNKEKPRASEPGAQGIIISDAATIEKEAPGRKVGDSRRRWAAQLCGLRSPHTCGPGRLSRCCAQTPTWPGPPPAQMSRPSASTDSAGANLPKGLQ